MATPYPTDRPSFGGNSASRPRRPSGPARTQRVEIELADNGGFMVHCYYKQGLTKGIESAYREPSKHAFGDIASTLKFVATSLKK